MLSINGLTLSYAHAGRLQGLFRNPPPPVVRDIDLDLRPGEILALVGESGSGKSTIARAISGRLRPRSGSISFEGHLLEPTVAQRQQAHLREIQYIFQNPDASLNPRRDVRAILERPLRHFGMDAKPDVLQTALESVRLPSGYLDRFPDQLSGGERQRIAIARALLAEPKLFICDEILSALDVSVQATIVDLLSSLRAERGVAMLFISHDLAVVRKLADRVAVLYQGELMQIGDKSALQGFPLHPYTEMLLRAAPDLHRDGYVPRLPAMPQSRALPGTGCPLAGRCPRQVGTVCAQVRPPLLPISGGFIRCHIPVAELGIVTE